MPVGASATAQLQPKACAAQSAIMKVVAKHPGERYAEIRLIHDAFTMHSVPDCVAHGRIAICMS
jgi:hypothetical protein